GGCLCSCNGRGQNMFGKPNHDAQMVQQRLGPLGLAGFFLNRGKGPVWGRKFFYWYTAPSAPFFKEKEIHGVPPFCKFGIEWHKENDQKTRDRRQQHPNKEMLVSDYLLQPTAEHAR